MKFNSLDIAMAALFIICSLLVCSFSIGRYKKGEYNPLTFRLRHGSEWSIKDLLAYFGFFMSIRVIQSNTLAMLAGIIGVLCILIVDTTLNIKSYKQTKDKRIIIQTSLFLISIFIFSGIIFILIKGV